MRPFAHSSARQERSGRPPAPLPHCRHTGHPSTHLRSNPNRRRQPRSTTTPPRPPSVPRTTAPAVAGVMVGVYGVQNNGARWGWSCRCRVPARCAARGLPAPRYTCASESHGERILAGEARCARLAPRLGPRRRDDDSLRSSCGSEWHSPSSPRQLAASSPRRAAAPALCQVPSARIPRLTNSAYYPQYPLSTSRAALLVRRPGLRPRAAAPVFRLLPAGR